MVLEHGLTMRRHPRGGRAGRDTDRFVGLAMTFPLLVPFIVFALLPLFWLIWISFTRYNGVSSPIFVGLDNYAFLLGDRLWWNAVRNTVVLTVSATAIQILLALVLAELLKRTRRGARALQTIYFVPYVTSIAVMGVVFAFLLRAHNGIANGLLTSIGVISEPVDFLGNSTTAMVSLIVVNVWAQFGFSVILLMAGLTSIPRDLYESAEIDGATALQQFRHVTIPLLKPIIVVATLLSIVFMMRTFDVVKTLTNAGPAGSTEVIFTYMFDYFFSIVRVAQLGYASAVAVAASVLSALLAAVYFWVNRRVGAAS